MNVQKIFDEMNVIDGLKVDTILFEEHYPVLFTCTANQDVYLFICIQVTSQEITWIASKTCYPTLIKMLQNEMTIRDSFLSGSHYHYIFRYKGKNKPLYYTHTTLIPDDWLPTQGEYINAENGEFAKEIEEFTNRQKRHPF